MAMADECLSLSIECWADSVQLNSKWGAEVEAEVLGFARIYNLISRKHFFRFCQSVTLSFLSNSVKANSAAGQWILY